jgi:hypothetical protein
VQSEPARLALDSTLICVQALRICRIHAAFYAAMHIRIIRTVQPASRLSTSSDAKYILSAADEAS